MKKFKKNYFLYLFRLILKHHVTEEHIYFHSYNSCTANTCHVLEKPYSVFGWHRIPPLINKLVTVDRLWDHATNLKPNSAWKVVKITNVSAFFTHMQRNLYEHPPEHQENPELQTSDLSHEELSRSSPSTALWGRNPFILDEAECSDDEDDEQDEVDEQNDEDDEQNDQGYEDEDNGWYILKTQSYGNDLCVFYSIAWRLWCVRIKRNGGKRLPPPVKRPKDDDSVNVNANDPPGWFTDADKRHTQAPNRKRLKGETQNLFKKFKKKYPALTQNWKGCTLDMIPLLEDMFSLKINVYERRSYPSRITNRIARTEVIPVYQSRKPLHWPTLNLDTNQEYTHVQIIRDMTGYERLWVCENCYRQFKVRPTSNY